jgi:hypothetical protein
MNFIAALVGAIVVTGAAIVVARRRRSTVAAREVPADVHDAQRKFLLFVLRNAPVTLEVAAFEAAARAAWVPRFGMNEDGSNFVHSGVPNVAMILQVHGNAFTLMPVDIAAAGRRTLDPPETCEPQSAAQLWQTYSHDISIGVAYNYDTRPSKLAAYVATLAAQFCDDHALAIYHPATRRLWAMNDDVRARLAAGTLSFFDPTA